MSEPRGGGVQSMEIDYEQIYIPLEEKLKDLKMTNFAIK